METDRKVVIRKICAWCGEVLIEGDQLTPVTGGICEKCKKKELEKVGIREDGEEGIDL